MAEIPKRDAEAVIDLLLEEHRSLRDETTTRLTSGLSLLRAASTSFIATPATMAVGAVLQGGTDGRSCADRLRHG
jgi:hypothetical protein